MKTLIIRLSLEPGTDTDEVISNIGDCIREGHLPDIRDWAYDYEVCQHEPAPRVVSSLTGATLPTCSKCGVVYLPDDADDE